MNNQGQCLSFFFFFYLCPKAIRSLHPVIAQSQPLYFRNMKTLCDCAVVRARSWSGYEWIETAVQIAQWVRNYTRKDVSTNALEAATWGSADQPHVCTSIGHHRTMNQSTMVRAGNLVLSCRMCIDYIQSNVLIVTERVYNKIAKGSVHRRHSWCGSRLHKAPSSTRYHVRWSGPMLNAHARLNAERNASQGRSEVWNLRSPGESLFPEVDFPFLYHCPRRFPYIISNWTSTTDTDAHGADSLLEHLPHNFCDRRSAWVHLHPIARASYFLGSLWPGDKHPNLQDFAATFHCKNLLHPGTHPFE